MEELLRVSNISKNFAGVQALDDVSFSIGRGEIRCLVGENGSGKSTLIKIIAGVYAPTSGTITIKGNEFKSLHPIDSITQGIQVIYQDFSLFPNLTAAENIALNNLLARGAQVIRWKEVHNIAEQAIQQIGVDIDLDTIVGDLSVADRQLIAITRALLQNAELIIMDEPTTALTQKEVEGLFKVVRSLNERGISFIFVSHKLSEVTDIADSVTILRNGEKVADGPIDDFDLASLGYHMTGRNITESSYEFDASKVNSSSLLSVKDLTLADAFSHVSFDLYPGEIVGITGLLGSGRTDLALALFGVEPANSGQIEIDGKPVRIRNIQDAMHYGIGYVPEDRLTEGLFLAQSIGRNVVIRIIDKTVGAMGMLSGSAMARAIKGWIERLSIKTRDSSLPVTSLSGGNQQRVVLAKWLAAEPRILILNGPTVGVDVGSKMELHDLIKDLARQGIGILIMSDDIPELMHTCNRILLMRDGRIVEAFETAQIDEKQLNMKLVEAIV